VFKEATTMLPSEYCRAFAAGPGRDDGCGPLAAPLTFPV
jgi:hypothetical protein